MFRGITQEWNWDSSVDAAARLQTGRSDFRTPEGVRNFSVLQNLQIDRVAYATSYWLSFLGVKSHRVTNHIVGGEGNSSDSSGPAPRHTQPLYSEYRVSFTGLEQLERGADRSEAGVDNG